jgi:hypothetical protein
MLNGVLCDKVQTIIVLCSTHKQKKTIFALFIRIARSCWLEPKGYCNKVFFANTHVESSFSIVLNDSRFMNEYKNIYHNGMNIGLKNAHT